MGSAGFGDAALQLNGEGYLQTPLGSKGRNYTLTFSVQSGTSQYGGALFSGPDSLFLNGNGTLLLSCAYLREPSHIPSISHCR